jgi:hypothetical protein
MTKVGAKKSIIHRAKAYILFLSEYFNPVNESISGTNRHSMGKG